MRRMHFKVAISGIIEPATSSLRDDGTKESRILKKTKRRARRRFFFHDGGALDADAEFVGLLIAGARVEVVRRAVIELVAKAKFATYIKADGRDCHAGGEPANNLERLALVLFVEK